MSLIPEQSITATGGEVTDLALDGSSIDLPGQPLRPFSFDGGEVLSRYANDAAMRQRYPASVQSRGAPGEPPQRDIRTYLFPGIDQELLQSSHRD